MQNGPPANWLPNGSAAFCRMLAAIESARESVRLETYIYAIGNPGDQFRAALAAAARRGVKVQVLVDGFGARALPDGYWEELRTAGGEVRVFNPLSLGRLAIRDHRKLLLVDNEVAFLGGFNVAPEYDGDGVTRGWFDLGLELRGRAATSLRESFEVLFAHHDFQHPRLGRWRHTPLRRALRCHDRQLVLATGPGLGRNVFHRRLLHDLGRARRVDIVSAYFAPGYRLRRALRMVVRRGGSVRLLLAGVTDVPLAQRAARAFYSGLLRAGVQIAEYQPQIMHAKLAIIDDAVFVGSSNLDVRSFGINYEIMTRIEDRALAQMGHALIASAWERSQVVRRRRRGFWQRLRENWARLLLTRIDPWLARRQLRRLV
ncbi:MAG TPA: phospholipase D-like domain-containing protein [Opitutaceae bacterium]|nr:phospholipase D-like domain-containing protein [Opitutaceae bacterium]